ncbi:hypothetical protein SISSUDRAFT_1043695 [Sistotremastrum suecicum HHB10207 ss-3]|uniref:Uncharacterized protein n=1 Tax=Sistotremastrum suecicum HHB10207 ss-3 TaxID=1314776 RepID=A0A166FL20_9AGAM|nr:hypothetical protein SISSUDRAFT_1043695 [Sistotremastrum suecicum HHB10207 ss-3]
MQLSSVFFVTLAAVLTSVDACVVQATGCIYPGYFHGDVTLYPPTDAAANSCGITLSAGEKAVSLPSAFFSTAGSSCGQSVIIVNSIGHGFIATVVNEDPTLTDYDITLTEEGLAALSPDNDPDHGTGPVSWTYEAPS